MTSKPNNDQLLKLYGLFKQASFGDNNTSKYQIKASYLYIKEILSVSSSDWPIIPSIGKPTFDIKGRAKWDAWTANKGLSQEEAEKQYIALVEELKANQ